MSRYDYEPVRREEMEALEGRVMYVQDKIEELLRVITKCTKALSDVAVELKENNESVKELREKYSDLIKYLYELIKVLKGLNSNTSYYIPLLNSKNREIKKLLKQLESKNLVKLIRNEGTELVSKKKFLRIERDRGKYLLWIDEINDRIWINGELVCFSNAPKQLLYDLTKNVKSVVPYSVLFNIHNKTHKKSKRYFKDKSEDRNLINRWAARLVKESQSVLSPYIICISRCASRKGDTKSGYMFDPQFKKFCIVYKNR